MSETTDERRASVPGGRTVACDGAAIRRLREQRGWTVQKLADEAICSVKTITSVENGREVFLATVAKIAKALNVHLSFIRKGSTAEEVTELPPGGPPYCEFTLSRLPLQSDRRVGGTIYPPEEAC